MALNGNIDQYQPLSDVYDGKSIFVTGSTGFLGKIFLEKILYGCPKISKVYILIRETAKMSVEEKLQKMLNCPIFQRLKDERPGDMDKIIPIIGDIAKPDIGINSEDKKQLIDNVSMVFHFAATVRFNEPLEVAININLKGTQRILDLCLKMKKIQVFLYVSTAFSNYKEVVIDEVLYPPLIPLSNVDTLMEQESFTEEQTKKILNGMPNTYTFTKALTENIVAKFHEKEGIPTVIVRPSVVISCVDEPLEGWIDNWFGATALLVSVAKGVMRAVFGDHKNNIDLIPADFVANLVIAAAARHERSNNVQVYNSCSSEVNPIKIGQLSDYGIKSLVKYKLNGLPLPGVIYTKFSWLMAVLVFVLEIVPAYILDLILLVRRKKPVFVKTQRKVTKVRRALEPFTLRDWNMRSANTSALAKSLSFHDRGCFPCDAAAIHWDRLISSYCQGIWKYLLKN